MELFTTPPALEFEKIAVPFTRMTGDTEQWPRVIMHAITQQAPYLADYELDVHLTSLDAAQGYGFGFVSVRNNTERSVQELAGDKPVNYLRVLVIIKDWQLYPFDIYMRNDLAVPLTEKRVREEMHMTETFDGTDIPPPDKNISADLFPPGYNSGFAGQLPGRLSGQGMNIGKFASGQPTFLMEALALSGSFHEDDLAKVAHALTDPATAWAVQRHDSVGPFLSMVADGAAVEKTAAPRFDSADVVQIERQHDGTFLLKAASASSFEPAMEVVQADRARSVAGDEVMDLEPGQSITAVKHATVTEDPVSIEPFLVKEAGLYSVHNERGPGAAAFVHTEVRNLDGRPMPGVKLAYALGDSGYSLTPEVHAVARMGGDNAEIPARSDAVEGFGFLVNPRTKEATVPFEVQGLVSRGGQQLIMVKTAAGKESYLELLPDLEDGPVKLAEAHYAVPTFFRFRKLANTPLALQNADGIEKQARVGVGYVDVLGSSGHYTLRSPLLDSIQGTHFKMVKEADALLILGAMGVSPEFAKEKLAHVERHGLTRIEGVHGLTSAEAVGQEKTASISKLASILDGHRTCLVKHALEVDDAVTVDQILGLNFLRPENIRMYVGYLPAMEGAVHKLADLLIATRIGLKPLSEDAVRQALFSLEEAVQQLKVLGQTGLSEGVGGAEA